MAFITDKDELWALREQSRAEAKEWKRDYPEFERLADNELIEDGDENLPEVNDGSLSAALFKAPKRIISSELSGLPRSLDKDDAWITELAKITWEDTIVPNANSQAPFLRKWKNAVHKTLQYGSIPIISLFLERGDYTGSDFIVANAYDVTLEPGKLSDYDSDVIFWDVYYSKSQLESLIEQAEAESKEAKQGEDGYNKWNVKELKKILTAGMKEERTSDEEPDSEEDKAVERGGFKFYVTVQRGVDAPFYMCSSQTQEIVREWSNPDPTGDVPIHFLYCYQDFKNPYGIGICKLAGGTQNVLDYMRKSDVLATQLGLRPPKNIQGDLTTTDVDSFVYAEDANWITGGAKVERMEIANGVYTQLPNRIAMYKTSLNQLIPTGDTSIGAAAGDPQYSKTPAGVKFQAANLSIDDEDFKDNLYVTYAAVAKSMINIHFANMQGTDIIKLSDDEREILAKSGVDFPVDEEGNPTNQFEINWDEARSSFDFTVEPDVDKESEEKERLAALLQVAELKATDPTLEQALMQSGKRLDVGELFSEIIKLTTDNEKIVVQTEAEEEGTPGEEPVQDEQTMQAAAQNVQAVMQQYGVDEQTAAAALEAERQGYPIDDITKQLLGGRSGEQR